MFIEMLALGRVKDPAEMQTVLDLLSKETARLSGMIESVLDWSRIESGKKTYDKTRMIPQELVDTSVAAFAAQRIGSSLNLSVTVTPNLPSIEVDRSSLAGALLNLLQNAYKYSKDDDKRIELRAVLDGDFVVIEVQDHGVGIPRSEQKRIFDRFYRVDPSRSTRGSGLGLAIARSAIERHGGTIEAESTPGVGTLIRVVLPKVHL
jgi:signal transduction histidine kinase